MKRPYFCFVVAVVVMSFVHLSGSILLAKEKGPSDQAIKNVYRQILASADKNGDGKLSMAECTSISKNKNKIEKDCKYWDANGDGYITEEEYVKQARNIMR
ncbi:MAG: EF-hand domain-containing protein [Syntrophaceae bacterium]|nr:EF-hand domain-containing protein [Syntrophaceae bacterium]